MSTLHYLHGFNNTFESEYIAGALPKGRNNPRSTKYYTEQLSGTAFTAPRCENRRTWLYRLQPSVAVTSTQAARCIGVFGKNALEDCQVVVDPLRCHPLQLDPQVELDFVSSLTRVVAAGDSTTAGLSIYLYGCNMSMRDHSNVFYNADGEFLIMPQEGTLYITTELGKLVVEPTELCVIPQGVVFQVDLTDKEEGNGVVAPAVAAKGYVLEVYHNSFRLPELGPIGSNGLANARDFQHPVAWCITNPDVYHQSCNMQFKMDSKLYSRPMDHLPFNVAAWHGNYVPYKYDLKRFCVVNSVSYDHLDPSIYTVLTCPSLKTGTALADVVIFPPRYMATDKNTFRPPWFHRNCMSEYMGLIYGEYDAKQHTDGSGGGDFVPGGSSLHNCMIPHGPDQMTCQKAFDDACETPAYFDKGLAFMFESCLVMKMSPQLELLKQDDYAQCWNGLEGRVDWKEIQANKKND